ncbi:MAG: aminodeoxychorismate/anthranilate synthase component II [Gemmatimonadetes bacterium]|nr:aminodeoxychorismate/anthranilate synthase component II [Gemmatimonadota bacterium]
MILLLDNYDSFVHNVARSIRELGARVEVRRSDALSVEEAIGWAPSHLVISPGPCTPSEAGISLDLVRTLDGRIPVLGICLGYQVVAEAYGGEIIPSPDPAHGRAVPIVHRGSGILSGLPSPFAGGLYHSLSVSAASLPPTLVAEAWTPDGELMALRHRSHPVWGVQFHPESILTPGGEGIFRSFLALGSPVVGADRGPRRKLSPAGGR